MDPMELVDHTEEAVNHVLEAQAAAPPAQNLYDCMTEQGQQYGVHVAETDIAAHAVDTPPDANASQSAFNTALADCHFDNYVEHDAVQLPSVTHPALAFAQVVFTSEQLNAGETQYFESQHAFNNAFESAYHGAVESKFDHQLDDHFHVDWGHQEAPMPHTVDRMQDFQTQNAFDSFHGFDPGTAATGTHDSSIGASSHADQGGSSAHGGGASSSPGDSGSVGP